MGLFSKEKCAICDNEVGALKRITLKNGAYLCNDCMVKTGICTGFTVEILRNSSLDEIKKRIEFHSNDIKDNLERIQEFNSTRKIGDYIWFDDNHKWFAIPSGPLVKVVDKNSYIFKYDEILDFEVLEDGTSVTKGGFKLIWLKQWV